MTYLPYTNILINALNAKRGHKELLNDLVRRGHRLSCCAITIREIYSGIKPADLPKVDEFLSALVWYGDSRSIARRAGRLRFAWAQQGTTLSLPDSLIAATALEHGLTLITDNRKHFPMPELQVLSLPGQAL